MIVFDLSCPEGHRFEGWFGSSEDFASQSERGLVSCPYCGSAQVAKAPMAPAVPRKGNQKQETPATAVARPAPPPEMLEALTKMKALQEQMLKQSQWVGSNFAEQSRAMHYGEQEVRTIHGQATLEEAKELQEEGIAVAPLPFPVAPPDDIN